MALTSARMGLFNRAGFVEYVCGTCRRYYQDSAEDVAGWMAVNLDKGVWPGHEMVWGKRVKFESQATTTVL